MIISDALNYFSCGYWYKEEPYTSSKILIKELSQCPPSRLLFEEAEKVIQELGLAALEIRLAPTNYRFRATTQGNIITINPDLMASEQRYLAIFELTNVIQLKEHIEVLKATVEGVYKSSEEYVRAVEFIEYKGNKRAKAVARAINKERGRFFRPYIKGSWEYLPIESIGFNLYYSLFIGNDHKEHHRNNWRLANKAFNISIYDNSCSRNEWIKRVVKISLLGCGIIATACATLINLNRLLKELMP